MSHLCWTHGGYGKVMVVGRGTSLTQALLCIGSVLPSGVQAGFTQNTWTLIQFFSLGAMSVCGINTAQETDWLL